MNRLVLSILSAIIAITCSLGASTAYAAKSHEVEEFDRYTDLGDTALRSKNYDSAFTYLEKASKLGNKVSQFTLALLYIEGLGVKQDYTEAYLWLNVASEVNEQRWRKVRDQIKDALSEEQIAALQPLVDEYIEKYGKETQEVSCYKKAETGTNRRFMQCTKHRTQGY